MNKASFSSMGIGAIVGTALLGVGALAGCGDSEGSGGSGGSSTQSNTATSSTTGASMQTTTGSSPTSTTTGGSTSSGPLMCDVEVTNITGNCDLFLQDCPDGETCIVFGDPQDPTIAIADCAESGLVGLGQPCEPGDCQEGMICAGTCTYACCPLDATVGANEPCGIGSCNLELTYTGTTSHVMVCTYDEVCVLFDPDSCPANKDCHYQSTGLTICSVPSPNNYMDGDVCDGFANDCPDMAICIDEVPSDMDMTEVCRYFCEEGSNAAPGAGGCPAGQSCNVDTYDFGFPNVGFCLPN